MEGREDRTCGSCMLHRSSTCFRVAGSCTEQCIGIEVSKCVLLPLAGKVEFI